MSALPAKPLKPISNLRGKNLRSHQEILSEAVGYHRSGQIQKAESDYRMLMASYPKDPNSFHLYGVLKHQVGDSQEAVKFISEAIRLQDDIAVFYLNRGIAHDGLKQFDRALQDYDKGITLDSRNAALHYHRGLLLKQQGELADAVEAYKKSIQLRSDYLEAHVNLASLLLELGNPLASLELLHRAIEIDPQCHLAHTLLASIQVEMGDISEASRHYQIALRLRPDALTCLSTAIMVPPVFRSSDEVNYWHRYVETNVNQMIKRGASFDPGSELCPSLFRLAYFGPIESSVVRDVHSMFESHPHDAVQSSHGLTHDENCPIRIGFVSSFLRNHTVGHLVEGLMAEMSQSRFEKIVFSIGGGDDDVSRRIKNEVEQCVDVSTDTSSAANEIRAMNCTVLFYPEIGMDAVTKSLAFHRLAPVQIVGWGHPVSTGISQIDYYLTSNLIEPTDGENHYSEQLISISRLPAFYRRPVTPVRREIEAVRCSLGIPIAGHIYGCPQSLFKFHPDFDSLLSSILERDPDGHLVLVEGQFSSWTRVLKERFQLSMSKVEKRVHFVPRMERGRFLELIAACDVLLDPIYFGSGNTCYESFAFGIPIVTMPGRTMRGRVTLGCYRQMEIDDFVAATPEEYVEIAVQLGTSAVRLQRARETILQRSGRLFGDDLAVKEIEDVIEGIVRGDS